MDRLLDSVASCAKNYGLDFEVLDCDPDFADTAAFNEKYGFLPEQGANTIVVTSKKVDPARYVICVISASSRLDVNKKITKLMGVKKASFADSETTKRITGMEIGGVSAVGVSDIAIYIDQLVMEQPAVVMGGGNRTSKMLIDPKELLKLPNAETADIALG